MSSTLLAIETATDVCSVALMQDGRVIADLTLRRPRAHAENLVPMIRDALRLGAVAPRDLDGVAVSAGPGSYTGLRIGVSTAKGLAFATEIPLVAVPSLEALAASVALQAADGDYVGALFNARRHECYAAVFRVTDQKNVVPVLDTAALPLADLPDWLDVPADTRLWLVGEGVPRATQVLNTDAGREFKPLDATVYAPSAAWVARCAMPRLAEGRTEDLAHFEPFYLNAFVAKKPQRSIFEKLSF